MFIGHFAPAFIAATHPKSPNLALLIIASQLVDFGFFGLALFGIENFRITPGITAMNPLDLYDMPYTHSLAGASIWGIGFGAIIYTFTKNIKGAIIGAAIVVSHWVLDFLVHGPDLTLIGSPPKLGFGLWNHPIIAMPLEFIITFAALAFYGIKTKAVQKSNSKKSYALYTMIAILLLLQAFDWFAPKPQKPDAMLMISALLSFTIVAIIAYWLGKTRMLKAPI